MASYGANYGPNYDLGGTGGGSGGTSKQVGVSVYDQDQSLTPRRPVRSIRAEAKSGVITTFHEKITGKLLLDSRSLAKSFVFLEKVRNESKGAVILKGIIEDAKSKLLIRNRIESFGFMERQFLLKSSMESLDKIMKKAEKFKRINKAVTKYNLMESATKLQKSPKKYEFAFHETVHDESLRAFTHSSSFIGNVQYNPAEQKMRIIINGKQYLYCSIPERLFDAFSGADSKGRFFTRFIRDQYEC